MPKRLLAVFILATAVWTTGCVQTVMITTEPTGATLKIGDATYTSPAAVELDRAIWGNNAIIVELKGHQSRIERVPRHSEWYNWFYAGPLRVYEYEDNYLIELEPNHEDDVEEEDY